MVYINYLLIPWLVRPSKNQKLNLGFDLTLGAPTPNTLSTAESFVSHNKSSHEIGPYLIDPEQRLKMMSLGMGE